MFVLIPLCGYLVDEPLWLWVSILSAIFFFNAVGTALMAAVNLMVRNLSFYLACSVTISTLDAAFAPSARVALKLRNQSTAMRALARIL